MDTNTLIAYLAFLQEHVFTADNVAKAQELGKNLADILADVYEFAANISRNAPGGSRDMKLPAVIADAGLTQQWDAIIDSLTRR